MKKTLTLLTLLFAVTFIYAQSHARLSYQSVVRNTENQLVVQGVRPSTNAIPGRVTLWGLVDDAIMVDSNEVAWTNGAKVFSNLDVTTSITNLARDSFRIDLFDWPDLPNGGPN